MKSIGVSTLMSRMLCALSISLFANVAGAECDGTTEWISQNIDGNWGVRQVCTTQGTSVLDLLDYNMIAVGCAGTGWSGDWDLQSFHSQRTSLTVQSAWIPASVFDGFSGGSNHALYGEGGSSFDESSDSCTVLPFYGCWGS